ncbi:FadR/GntR family transcriptional regulator, partial [Fusobacterium necrophorum]
EENEGRKMVFKPIENRKISSRIMEQIKENILRGKLRVGDKLPSERELSTQLGVSRSSVREALRSLDILGVVVSVQGEGTYIQGDF